MDTQSERWQQEDEEQAFLRCIELVQMAKLGQHQERNVFSEKDIEDLIYFLGLKEYFK